MILVAFYLLFTLVISWWNARVCGEAWIEANAIGGWGKLLVWCGAAQSAIGFTIVYLVIEAALIGLGIPSVGHKLAANLLKIGYLLMIVPAVGTGLVLTIHSWIAAYKERNFANIGTAAYNTIAQFHNMSGMGSGISSGWGALEDVFDDEDGWKIGLILVALIVAFGGGIATTYSIVQRYKGSMGFLDAGEPV